MKKVICYLFVLFTLFSCLNDKDEVLPLEALSRSAVVLKARDANHPWLPYGRERPIRLESTKADNIQEYLGYGWKGANFFDSYVKNISYPVFDSQHIIADGYVQYNDMPVYQGASTMFSYSNFENYVKKSTTTKKISSGFSLNLGLFSIGTKKTMTEIFTNSYTSDARAVFGELDIQYESRFHKIQYSSAIADLILEKYLNKNFIRELYSTTPGELYKNYGGFVLTNFVVGGKAIALYSGFYKGTASESIKESDLDKDISASYGFKLNNQSGSVSGNLGFGNNYNNGQTYTGKFTGLKMAVKTIGGSSQIPVFTSPTSVENINLNLDAWLSSLSQSSYQTIIDIEKDGLVPLTDFILEENVKEKVMKCINGGGGNVEDFHEPYIQFSLVMPTNMTCLIGVTLHTRYDEVIPIRRYECRPTSGQYVLDMEKNRLSKLFNIKMVGENWFSPSTSQTYKILQDPLDISSLKKVVDTNTGAIIILNDSKDSDQKYAYTIRIDRVVDDYVMSGLLDSLPVVQMSLSQIKRNYKLIAL